MRAYRPQFRDRATGKTRLTVRWYLDFRDHLQVRRRIPAGNAKTKPQAERFGTMLESLIVAKQYGDRPDRALVDWLHGLPKGTLRKFADFGLIDGEFVCINVSLTQHVVAFEAWLKTTRARHGYARAPLYIHNTVAQVHKIIHKGRFTFWSDVTKAGVEACLGKLAVASKTNNNHLGSFRAFANWMIASGRASTNPVKSIQRVRWTKTKTRRALTQDEAFVLLRATAVGPEYFGMTGVERATAYLCALETGYRLGELRALTAGCFDCENATVNLAAEHCKNRMEAVQYLKRSRANQYRAFLAGKKPDEPVFALPDNGQVMIAFRRDLQAAGIEGVNDRGVEVTFHSLRYALATALDRSGASLKERMTIMRHSDKGSLTMGTYTTLEVIDLRGAVARLPDYPWPSDVRAAAENHRQRGVA